jgi:hypothetical protein
MRLGIEAPDLREDLPLWLEVKQAQQQIAQSG